jgi:hypothetical protein
MGMGDLQWPFVPSLLCEKPFGRFGRGQKFSTNGR